MPCNPRLVLLPSSSPLWIGVGAARRSGVPGEDVDSAAAAGIRLDASEEERGRGRLACHASCCCCCHRRGRRRELARRVGVDAAVSNRDGVVSVARLIGWTASTPFQRYPVIDGP